MIAMTSADGMVLVLFVVLALSFGIVLTMVLTIRASLTKRNRDVEELLEEVAAEVAKEARTLPAAGSALYQERQPWEREADWWKK
ncbi:MAG: hypothetical protein QM627_00230 [Luteolibacter sp.]